MAVGFYSFSGRFEIDANLSSYNLIVLKNTFPSTPSIVGGSGGFQLTFPYGVALDSNDTVVSTSLGYLQVAEGAGAYNKQGVIIPTFAGNAFLAFAYNPEFTDNLSAWPMKTFPLWYLNIKQYYNA